MSRTGRDDCSLAHYLTREEANYHLFEDYQSFRKEKLILGCLCQQFNNHPSKTNTEQSRSFVKLVTFKQHRFCDDAMVKKLVIHVCVTVWCVMEAYEVHSQKSQSRNILHASERILLWFSTEIARRTLNIPRNRKVSPFSRCCTYWKPDNPVVSDEAKGHQHSASFLWVNPNQGAG